MKKVTSICLIFFMALTTLMGTALAAPEFTGKINSKIAYMLMDADSGKELHSQNRDVQIEPASTTKILTCLLAIENSSMTDVVTVSQKADNTEGSVLNIKKGEEIVMKDLLLGLMLKSGNDAAVAIAEHVSGTTDDFVALMNAKATEIGMTASHFANPNGLHDESHYSTVLDMAKLAQYALKNPTFMEIVGTTEYEMPKTNKRPKDPLENSNALIIKESKYYYEGATGMKTGRTTKAGGCLVATATRDGMNLICVTFNDHTPDRTDRWPATKSLFDYGFENYKTVDIAPLIQNSLPAQIQIEGYSPEDVGKGLLEFKKPDVGKLYVTLDKNAAQALLDGTDTIESVPAYDKEMPIKAPVNEGDILGSVTYKIKATGETIYTDNLIAARDVFKEGSSGGTAVATIQPTPSKEIENTDNGGAIWLLLLIPGGLIVFLVIRMVTVSKNKRFKKRRRPHYSYRIK